MTSHCANWGLNRKQIIIGRFLCKETIFIGVARCRETVLLGQTPRVINALMTSLFSISFPVAVRDTLTKSNLIEEKNDYSLLFRATAYHCRDSRSHHI